uniref:Nipped-B protein n=1 Tax=Elaeophora elaphi TaxID=1147741 RepID=A0A158Q833_9BILA
MNNINSLPNSPRATSSPAVSANAQNPFYNQQMLLQQQYMQIPSLYGGQQTGGIMLQQHPMDIQTFQQQQHLLQVMQQQQQQQQVLQNHQRSLGLHESQTFAQQQVVLQQQQYQRALQQAAQQQQQQRQLEQQRLLEQQQRQLDLMHQEREAARLKQQQDELLRQKAEALARQQQEEAARLKQEELRRIAYQKEQQLKQQREAHERLRVEQQRILEEQKRQEEVRKLEEQRKEMEKVRAIREQQNRKQREAREAFNVMKEKADSFPIPIHLAGCHTLTKLVNHLPFPSLYLPYTNNLKCETVSVPRVGPTQKEILIQAVEAISQIETSDVVLKHEDGETNDFDVHAAPCFVRELYEINNQAFDVDIPQTVVAPEIMNVATSASIETETDVMVEKSAELQGQITLPKEDIAETSATAEVESLKIEATSVSETHTPSFSDTSKSTTAQEDEQQVQLRRQIVSLGKQPKAQQTRRKKDMVESLFDSLTGYFDPTEGRRRRQRTKTYEEEQNEKVQMELFAQMEKVDANEKEEKGSTKIDHRPDHVGTSKEGSTENNGKPKFFEGHKKGRKRVREKTLEQPERPPTPTEVIQQRELEWRERQRKRREKHKRRQNESESECWNNEVMAEKESYMKFTTIIDQIFETIDEQDFVPNTNADDDCGIPQDFLDKDQLEELRQEAQKLKSWKKINKVNPERLVKLLTILEKNIRDIIGAEGEQSLIALFNEEDEDDASEAYREAIGDRILRAADASCTAMLIMTSTKMPKQVFIEDPIDRSIQLCKQFLNNIVYPTSDSSCRASNKGRKNEDRKRKKSMNNARSRIIKNIYTRVTELVGCFAELVRTQSLTDTAILQLCTLASGPFFVDNVGELQMQSIKLLSAIFSRYENFRKSIIQDLLSSVHRLPPIKTSKNSYRMTADEWISNMTVLIMQLVQSVVKVPRRRRSDETFDVDEETTVGDTVVKDSVVECQKMASLFLSGFLAKCTAKSEEDYRRLFDQFVHDLLTALYKPEWPAAEMLLTLLGNVLVTFYRSKNVDMSLRIASLDYLGTVTASLRKDMQQAISDDIRLDVVVKTLLYEELEEEEQTGDIDTIDISHMSPADKMKKVQRALIDYLVERRGDADVSIEYAIMFYVGIWYKEVYEEAESAKQKLKQIMNSSEISDKEKRKFEKKSARVLERCQLMKVFLIKTADKKHMRKRAEQIARTGSILMDSDASWLVRFLASSREFSQSFSTYLNHILYGIHAEQAVGLRTKAMRCLTLIIEADHAVLKIPEVRKAVQARMMDPNAAVREATIELIGKYLIAKPEYVPQYYPLLIERIKDSGVAVRKRIIRILREICEKQPDYEKVPEMLARVVRRISDEEGVKKLTIDTMQSLLFQPARERDSIQLINKLCFSSIIKYLKCMFRKKKKVMTLTDMVQICIKENTLDFFEQLLNSLLKSNDRTLLFASRQIVDTLVDNVLTLDSKMASGGGDVINSAEESTSMNAAAARKEQQERMLACLSTLSLFSKAKPDLMVKHAETLQPYLSMNMNGPAEQQVMNQVVNMLERVVPLMDHPSESFLKTLDESLYQLVKDGGMRIIASSLACNAAIYNKWKKRTPAVIETFFKYLKYLHQIKEDVLRKQSPGILPVKKPMVLRSLFSIGLMSRYFNLDAILENDEEAKKFLDANASTLPPPVPSVEVNEEHNEDEKQSTKSSPFVEMIFQVLTTFCRYRDGDIRLKALNAIGNFTATNSEYLTRTELRNMYMTLLGTDDKEYLGLKIQTLKNLELFLSAEETKMVKNNSEWHISKEEHDLKEMELANSGLASAIIQLYWNAVLNSYYNSNDAVRTAAVQVAILTLSQGLVTPGSSIPTLIAMSTDQNILVRNKVENMLRDIDSKYAGMVPSKAVSGIRCSFRLHMIVKRDPKFVLRGIRACDQTVTVSGSVDNPKLVNGVPKMTNDGQALLSGLYQNLRSNRQQRRSFLSSILRLFSEDSREKLTLEEWLFVADNLAMFPYQVIDEPLYVIRRIESIVSISGQNIINNFMGQLLPRPNNVENDDEAEYTPELIYRRFPEDKSMLHECMKNSQACFILLYLKNFLMKLYGFSDAKVQEYSPSEAAKVYEKALSSRRNMLMFNPHSALQELRPETAQKRDTVNGHIEMANQIVAFRNMLLSLDRDNGDEHDGTDSAGPMETVSSKDTISAAMEGEDQDTHMADTISDATSLSEADARSA